MTFLRNAWYCAAWSQEIGTEFLARKLLNEPVLLYRKQNGEPTAIGNRCPHRFAPLALGKRVGDSVQCGYHGLVFDASGACIGNPHDQGIIPTAAKVPSYPIVERYGAVWIWMGDPSLADDAQIPDFSLSEERPGWAAVRGRLLVKANYQMVADNLLDLSHVRFLHPFLSGAPSEHETQTRSVQEHNGTIWHYSSRSRASVSPLFDLLWAKDLGGLDEADGWSDMRWDAPANLFLDTGMTRVGTPREEGALLPFAHLLTPETAGTTHYFWGSTRNCKVEDRDFDAVIGEGIRSAFEFEDEPMIVACYEMMGCSNDLMSLRPILLKGDAAAVRARRLLTQRLAAEAASSPPSKAE